MKVALALALVAGVAAFAHGSPLVIEETSKIAPPPGVQNIWGPVGLYQNDAVVLGFQSVPSPVEGDPDITIGSAYLFHRYATSWSFVRKLAEARDYNIDDAHSRSPVAMRDGLMALAMEPLHVFEKVGTDWVEKPVRNQNGGDASGHDATSDVDIDGGRIFLSVGGWAGVVYDKNTTNDSWLPHYLLNGDDSGDGDNAVGGPADISPNWAVLADPYNQVDLPAPAVHVFQHGTSGWPLYARLAAPAGHSFGDVALRDKELFITDYSRFGVGLWRRNAAGTWYLSDALRTAGDFANVGPFDGVAYGNYLHKDVELVYKLGWNADRQAYVVNVFQPDSSGGRYRHIAILAAKNGESLGGQIASSGNDVLVNGENGPYYFRLPSFLTPPATYQDTFSTGNGANWTWISGSQFTAVQSGASRVFRQSSTAASAGAVLGAYDWTDQSIEADITPRAVNGNDRWVGLATRHTDASNYYYVTLRSSGVVQLKRMQGGAFTTLAAANVPWALGRTYRLRLETVGTTIHVYVNGALAIDTSDSALTHGNAALLSYRVAADYDNVIVSPAATQTIYTASEGQVYSPPRTQPAPWTYAGGFWQWEYPASGGSGAAFRQTSTSGTARAVVGPPRVDDPDQIVQARLRPTAFSTTGDPWFGLMARYQDSSNYLYVGVRKGNTLMLSKLVNGSVVALGSVPFTVSANTWYPLKLEAVGAAVRAYVNGQLVLEATDPQPASGRVGLVNYRTAVDNDDFQAVTP